MDQYTEKVFGKRQWKQTMHLAEMFDRYQRSEKDTYAFFRGVLIGELGLVDSDFTSYLGTYDSSYSHSLVLGDRVQVFPFEDHHWVVKHGGYERVLERMEDIFDLIREAWGWYER